MGNSVVVGVNDLATTHPDVAAEWDYEKNAPLTPEQVSKGSHNKAFWVCPENHKYEASIKARSLLKTGCPYCSGRMAIVGVNDLGTTHPDIAAEWDYEKNAPLTPEQVKSGSNKKMFWRCSLGHSYNAVIPSRTSQGTGCPICSGRTVLDGFNDLATTHPDLLTHWDYEKNSDTTPQQTTKGSDKKVWWRCDFGHSYQAIPTAKTRSKPEGCPVCAGKRVVVGVNDLATTHPDVAAEWDYEKNAPLTPQQVVAGKAKKVDWICPKGHSYNSLIHTRTRLNTGCPICVGQKLLVGFNDLATTHPDVAAEWDYEKNAPLTPQHVIAGTEKKVSWNCPNGHSYKSAVNHRAGRGRGCPNCSNSGYDQTREGLFYFIASDSFRARKVGITNPGRSVNRVEKYGADWKILWQVNHHDGHLIRNLETKVLRWLRVDKQMPAYLGREEMGRVGGQSETFSMDGPSDQEVIRQIEIIFRSLNGAES